MLALLLVILCCSIVKSGSWHEKVYGNVNVFQKHYTLPDLPYQYDQLEPYIDEKTLRVHHLGHHKTYTDKLNAILKEWRREVSYIVHEFRYRVLQLWWLVWYNYSKAVALLSNLYSTSFAGFILVSARGQCQVHIIQLGNSLGWMAGSNLNEMSYSMKHTPLGLSYISQLIHLGQLFLAQAPYR